METTDVLKAVAAMQPIVNNLMHSIEGADVSGEAKKAHVMDLAGAIYEGARRTGALDGVRETRGLAWVDLAPLLSTLIDGLVAIFKAIGLWFSRSK
jgi:hypothetical protein